MKKLVPLMVLASMMITVPALAENMNKYALGNMYTNALNYLEASGMLDTLEPKGHVPVTDIHVNHGQVFITLMKDTGPTTVTFDPIANKILYNAEEGTDKK